MNYVVLLFLPFVFHTESSMSFSVSFEVAEYEYIHHSAILNDNYQIISSRGHALATLVQNHLHR